MSLCSLWYNGIIGAIIDSYERESLKILIDNLLLDYKNNLNRTQIISAYNTYSDDYKNAFLVQSYKSRLNKSLKEYDNFLMDSNKKCKETNIIYVLELEESKYYIGKTTNLTLRFSQHKEGKGALYTKIYKPHRIVETFECKTAFCEDKYVKIYMLRYGINNVRGGSYVLEKLSIETISFLEREMNHAAKVCLRCGSKDHYIKDCSNMKIDNWIKHNKGKRWSIEDDRRLIEMFNSKKTIPEIASFFKRTNYAIECRLRKNNLI